MEIFGYFVLRFVNYLHLLLQNLYTGNWTKPISSV